MAKIIISHRKDYKEKWCPINEEIDIKRLVEDLWTEHIKESPHYLQVIKLLSRDLICTCDYPRYSRPVHPKLFENYHGCIFDLDAYCEGKEDYLGKEIKSLPPTILAGGISKHIKDFMAIPPAENWFEKPINNEIDIILYLQGLLILIRASLDENFAKGFYETSRHR